ncbi:oxidoreductase [Terriglobus sp. RCC_193]|uniref:oxidoreductase n=1 Tax=Terriglobus sp. RCC_193 TaxID=3239218 RepID=UPI003526C2B6
MLPVRTALLGFGYAGRTFHAPLLEAVEGIAFSLVGSSRPEDVHAHYPHVRVSSAQDAVVDPEIELVVIATPNDSHFPLAAAALRAGKHVVVDKPFTLNLQEAKQLQQIANEYGRILSVFHNRRWESEINGAREVLQSGVLGQVTHYELHMDRFRPNVRQRWRENPGPGAGLWFDLGPHMIDAAIYLFGMPQAIQGNLATLRPGGKTDDWGHAILHYPHMRAVLNASLLVAGTGPRSTLHGTTATWMKYGADTQEPQLQSGMSPNDPAFGIDPDGGVIMDGATGTVTPATPQRGCQQKYYESIRDAIRTGTAPAITAQDAVNVMAVLDAFYFSAREGRTVSLQHGSNEP